MPSLLDLSPELIAAALDILSSNSPALDSLLSLSGNHNLLAFARPYTWRELNVTLSSFKKAELEASSALASRIESFYADPVKTAAAISLNIKVIGIFHSDAPAVLARLLEDIHKLVNATHLSLDGLENRGYFQSPGSPIKWAESLPSVMSLNVECCESRNDKEYEDCFELMENPPKSLVHIVTRFSGHRLGYFLEYCPNIQVLEIEGGDLFEFWRNNTQKDASGATQSDFEDTTMSPLSPFLYRNESLFSTLRKLKIVAEWQDVWCISDFFAHYKEPPAVLKEVFINILMYEDDYQKILLVFAALSLSASQ